MLVFQKPEQKHNTNLLTKTEHTHTHTHTQIILGGGSDVTVT